IAAAIGQADQADPGMTGGVPGDRLGAAVARAVVEDQPERRRHGLAQDARDRDLEMLDLVAQRRQDDVTTRVAHSRSPRGALPASAGSRSSPGSVRTPGAARGRAITS